jgi:transcriptional regulator with XRE-family HTH domain
MTVSGNSILTRIRERLAAGQTLPEFCAAVGIPASTLYSWGTNNTVPKAVDLLTIADYLGVSMRLLLTGRDETGLNEEEAELAALYRALPPSSKRLVLGLARLAADAASMPAENMPAENSCKE